MNDDTRIRAVLAEVVQPGLFIRWLEQQDLLDSWHFDVASNWLWYYLKSELLSVVPGSTMAIRWTTMAPGFGPNTAWLEVGMLTYPLPGWASALVISCDAGMFRAVYIANAVRQTLDVVPA